MEMKEFKELLMDLSEKINKIKSHLKTEEATKNALIMPLLQILDYDIFDPQEVVPEYIADVGIKKGEKVDYAIFRDKKLSIIIECKTFGTDLNKSYYIDQLYRYFSVSEVSIAILTNGEIYMFYTDIEEKNKMDQKPFMTLNMLDIQEALIPELKRLSKTDFDINNITTSATDLRLTKDIENFLEKEISSPSDSFTSYIASEVAPGKRKTSSFKCTVNKNIKRAFTQLIKKLVKNKLGTMIEEEDYQNITKPIIEPQVRKKRKSTRKLSGFYFEGAFYETKYWREVLSKTCALMVERHQHEDEYKKLLDLRWFSTNKDSISKGHDPKKIDHTNLYVETNYSADSIEKMCKKIVECLGHDPNKFSIKE